MNLTEKWIEKQKPGKERLQFRDDTQPGFGLRIEPNGRKSFYFYAKVAGRPTFRSLGEYPIVTVKEARAEAAKLAGQAADWKRAGYPADQNPFQKIAAPKLPASAPTFAQLVEAYIQNHVKVTAARPVRAQYDVQLYSKTHFAAWQDRTLDSLTIQDLLAVKNACAQRGKLVAANRCVQFCRRLFKWSAGDGETGQANFWPMENFAKRVRTFKEKARERFLQPEELVRFQAELEKEQHADLRDFLILSLSTGARRSAVLGMRWADLDFARENWHVPQHSSKNGESYEVSLSGAAVATLGRRRKLAADSATYVFPGVGQSGHLLDLKKAWQAFRRRAQIPDVHVHDLRRTCGSYLAMSGASLPIIGKALGHRSTASTAIYSRLMPGVVADARAAGERKMRELMRKAQKHAGLSAPKLKLIKAAS
jgi:integrase